MQQEQSRSNSVSQQKNLLAEHIMTETETAKSHLSDMKRAVKSRDIDYLKGLAKALNEACGRCGAFRMVSLCVSLQMLGGHSFVEKAQDIVVELEAEYHIFRRSLQASSCI